MYKIVRWDGSRDGLLKYSNLLSETYNADISHEYLIWKHINNPVGRSIIYFAFDKSENLVAARAFWYNFSHNNATILQPCDTVTCKKHQRKGLFSKLTLKCLDEIKSKHDNYTIINFPNENSMPGYLKLGWGKYSSLKKSLIVGFKFNHKAILKNLNEISLNDDLKNYLDWRFFNNPIYKYKLYHDGCYIYIKKGNNLSCISVSNEGINEAKPKFGISCSYTISNKSLSLSWSKLCLNLSSKSKIVFLDENKDRVDHILDKFSPLFLMDTF